MGPTVRTLGVRARRVLICVRLLLVGGVLTGLPNIAPDSPRTGADPQGSSFSFSDLLKQFPVQADQGIASSGLQDWPDLFGEKASPQTIHPTGGSSQKPLEPKLTKRTPSKPVTQDRPLQPRTENPPFLETMLKQSLVAAEQVAPPATLAKAPSAPASSQTKISTTASARSSDSEKAVDSAASRKGFVIKVEGDGKELVVYDAQGKEVLRKSRKRESSEGTTISGAGKTVTNRGAEPDEKRVETAKSKPTEKSPEPIKSRLVFDEVKKGENLSLIASRYQGVTFEDLMRVNQIDNPHTIPAGTKIWVPCDGLDGVCHVAGEGETLSSLLKRYEIEDMRAVCDLNGMDYLTANRLNPGQMVVLPDAKPKNQPLRTHTARAIRSDLSKLKGNVRWQWPVDDNFQISSTWGRRVDPFSRKSSGDGAGGPKPRFSMHHGIDLAVPVGTPVYAARDGEVIEVSRSRYGHGNMIKIRHEDGWCTVYSHNSELLKKEGDLVKQGDLIALSGNSGRSTGPHLHFEVRRPNQESVNPKNLLPNR